jgi:protein-tyrosine phosphatase
MSREKLKVLVVCLGNICRSPAGEAALREAAPRPASTWWWILPGPGPGTWATLPIPRSGPPASGPNLAIDGRGRQVRAPDELEEYDLILAMDRSNLHALRQIAPDLSNRMHLYRGFDPHADHDEMPDPYGLADEVFDDTVDRARSGARAIVDAIRAGRLP